VTLDDDAIAAILALNAESVDKLHPIAADELRGLAETAYRIVVTPDRDAFMIALDHDSKYDSPNFAWFKERYARFAYVDRIAVSERARGKGHGRRLYTELFEEAAADGYPLVAAEVNSDPPNPVSDAFHEAMGFEIVGERYLPERGKSVRYMVRNLP
jgi:hypothetical protein